MIPEQENNIFESLMLKISYEILAFIWVTQTSVTESRTNNLVTLISARVSGKSSHEEMLLSKKFPCVFYAMFWQE